MDLYNSKGQRPSVTIRNDKIQIHIPDDEYLKDYLTFLMDLNNAQ